MKSEPVLNGLNYPNIHTFRTNLAEVINNICENCLLPNLNKYLRRSKKNLKKKKNETKNYLKKKKTEMLGTCKNCANFFF